MKVPLMVVAVSLASAQTYTIRTVAGTGTQGVSGDNGLATVARLAYPSGVCVDASGNLYIADYDNHRVRRVTPAGVITTVAGDGTQGYGGDGGPAVNAQLSGPIGVAMDKAGNLYIADLNNHRIRRVNSAGVITTVAGNGTHGFSGDDGPATSAEFSGPIGVAVDASGNLYIANEEDNRIRRVSVAGIITTVAGNGTYGFGGDNGRGAEALLASPYGVATDGAGNLYIADLNNHRVRRLTPAGIITTVAGTGTQGFGGDNGPATSAMLNCPAGVAVDAAGNLYIADYNNNRIRRVSPAGIITTIAGNGTLGFNLETGLATEAQLNNPSGVTMEHSGNLFVADSNNHRIRLLSPVPVVSCTAVFSPAQLSVPAGTGGATVDVNLNTTCGPWMAVSNQAWLTVAGGSPGTGNGTVQLTFAANPSGTARAATLTIAGQTVQVTQAGACALTVNSSGMTTSPAEGRTGQLGITLTAGNCAWTARSSHPWLELFPFSGTTNGNVGFTVYPNFSTRSRTATITVGTETVTITQSGMTGTADARFVRRAYFNTLRRLPTAADEAFHVASLATRTRAQVMQSFLEGGEFRAGGAFVTAVYRVLLGRVPESGGWAFQLNSVVSYGTAQAALVAAFLNTPEWQLKQGASVTNEQFVRLLFQEVLGRQPSAEELAFQLPGAANRGQLATNFLGIPEFWARNGPTLNALHAYFVILGRDPTPAELAGLEATLRAGTPFGALVAEFLGSSEHTAALQ